MSAVINAKYQIIVISTLTLLWHQRLFKEYQLACICIQMSSMKSPLRVYYKVGTPLGLVYPYIRLAVLQEGKHVNSLGLDESYFGAGDPPGVVRKRTTRWENSRSDRTGIRASHLPLPASQSPSSRLAESGKRARDLKSWGSWGSCISWGLGSWM